MATSIEGQTVRVTTKRPDGGSPTLDFYAVAESDPKKAEAIVTEAIGANSDELVEAIGLLSAAEITALGLGPGQFERL